MKSLIVSIVVFLVAAIAAGWIYLRRFERAQLYHPSAEIAATPAQFQLRFQDVNFVAADGTALFGWWIPANRPYGTVVYCHGNDGNIGDFAHLAPEFFRRGFNLFLWDYRGFGRSGGRPTEEGLYEDARAAYDAALEMSPDLPIIVYGLSLGGAVAIQMATDRHASGLIVEASFASAADLARRWYPNLPLDRLLSVSFDSTAKVAALEGVPKLFGHSIQDEIVPFQSGRILHAAAAQPSVFTILSGRHTDSSWFVSGAPGNADFEAFLARYKPKP